MFDIERLKEFQETARLIAVLRFAGGEPERRAAAAKALGELEDIEVVESLIRAHLGDPEESVREAAYQALLDLLSSDADLAISAYKIEPGELDDWLIAAENELAVLSALGGSNNLGMKFPETGEAAGQPEKNASLLVETLRFAGNPPETRARAAHDLGKLFRMDFTESLVRAYLEDPHQAVRDAAYLVLDDLYANRKDMVIASYSDSMPYDDPWMIAEEDALSAYDGMFAHQISTAVPGMQPFDDIEFEGLIALLKSDSPIELRVKAVELLQYSTDARAVEWLLKVALDEEEDMVRQAAERILDEIFPGDAERMLSEFRVVDDEEPEEDWMPVEPAETVDETRTRMLIDSQPPAVTQEKNLLPVVIIVLVFVFIILIAFIAVSRGFV